MVGWDEIQVEGTALASTVAPALAQYVDNGNDKDSGMGWLSLRPLEASRSDQAQFTEMSTQDTL